MTVALDHRITPELYSEWLAREFVHHVQNMRKDADLEVTQRIKIMFDGSSSLVGALEQHSSYIQAETLAVDFQLNSSISALDMKIGDQLGKIEILV